MIKLIVVTPSGTMYDDMVEYVIVDGNNGQMGILENHVPVVIPVRDGFVKLIKDDQEEYFTLSGAIVEQSNNIVTIIAQESEKGQTLEEAKSTLQKTRELQKKENTRKLMDFTKMEKELAQNLKEIKAGNL